MNAPTTGPNTTPAPPIVIVGGGHAGVQLCMALAAAGQASGVTLVCGEAELPYQRPPLSKAFVKEPATALQALRPEGWYADAGIRLRRGDPVVTIDRERRTLKLCSGAELPYGTLVLATGARARPLAQLPASLTNVVALRSAGDAARLRRLLHDCNHVTILGGGFIGLEIAAGARLLNKAVQVFEAAPRLLPRAVSADVAEHVLATHRSQGIDIRLGARVEGYEIEGDRLVELVVAGARHPVDLVILGVGAEPEVTLAREAGLACDNGILVDEQLRTEDPAIFAIGDCARFATSMSGDRLRLESIQNATDQARALASALLGSPKSYQPVPWFWSDQGTMRLQMVGLRPDGTEAVRRPGSQPGSFSVLHYDGARLVCVESVNAPGDHLAARKLLEAGRSVPRHIAGDPSQPLKI
jgi:3-phenylpropionate/trans-cinnamate dioxygenase ferredoxin reductase subunit